MGKQAPPPPYKIPSGQINADTPILHKFKEGYLLWHNFLYYLPRSTRHTLGIKVENLFTEILEITLRAQYAKRENKFILLKNISDKLDSLKFFITLLWETKSLTTNKYTQLAKLLTKAGSMLGGWINNQEKTNY